MIVKVPITLLAVVLSAVTRVATADCSDEQPNYSYDGTDIFEYPDEGKVDVCGLLPGPILTLPYTDCDFFLLDEATLCSILNYGPVFNAYCGVGNCPCGLTPLSLELCQVPSLALACPQICDKLDVNFPSTAVDESEDDNTIVYEDAYPAVGEADEFKSLCEEAWACSQYTSQFASSGDEGKESLCFDDSTDLTSCSVFFPTNTAPVYRYYDDVSGNTDERRSNHRARTQFVISTCYGSDGGCGDQELGRPLGGNYTCNSTTQDCDKDTLTEVRDATCESAERLANRTIFTKQLNEHANRSAACDELIECFTNFSTATLEEENANSTCVPSADLNPDDIDGFGLEADLCDASDDELEERKELFCGLLSGTDSTCTETIPQGEMGCRALPWCPAAYADKFQGYDTPWPVDEAGYSAATASIKSFIVCQETRIDTNIPALMMTIKFALESVLIIFQNLYDGLPEGASYSVWILAINVVLDTGILALDAVLSQIGYHDDLVEAAEIEATYENTLQLLDGSAAIYDEVVCRCVDAPRRGHGCDSVDNDCDQVVDECDEDVFSPEIDIGQALCQCGSGTGCGNGQIWYLNDKDPEDCVDASIIAQDDCDPDITVNTTLYGTCYDSYIKVETEDWCNNTADPKTVGVWIDKEDPRPTCHFGDDVNKKMLVLDDTGQGQLADVGLRYDATDNCGGDLAVKVAVYANEIEDFQSQEIALLYQEAGDTEERVGLYVATAICQVKTNGQCVKDPKENELDDDFRIYTVVVTATDPSGRTDTAECKIVIVPETWKKMSSAPNIAASTQRFFLTSHESVFTDDTLSNARSPTLATTEEMKAGAKKSLFNEMP